MKQILLTLSLSCMMTGCTLSFQNMDTHGTASDLVDETLSTTPTVTAELTEPAKAL